MAYVEGKRSLLVCSAKGECAAFAMSPCPHLELHSKWVGSHTTTYHDFATGFRDIDLILITLLPHCT